MIESFYIKALIYSKNYTEFNCIEIFCDFLFVRQLNALQRKKKKLETVMWGSEPVVWGLELLCGVRSRWCGVRRSVLQIMGFGGQKCGAHGRWALPPSSWLWRYYFHLFFCIEKIICNRESGLRYFIFY